MNEGKIVGTNADLVALIESNESPIVPEPVA